MSGYQVYVFAGTSEGRILAEKLAEKGIPSRIFVVSEYGASLLPENESVEVSAGRLGREEMCQEMRLLAKDGIVFDATHPYAVQATENIRAAAGAAGRTCFRVLRGSSLKSEENADREGNLSDSERGQEYDPEIGCFHLHSEKPEEDPAGGQARGSVSCSPARAQLDQGERGKKKEGDSQLDGSGPEIISVRSAEEAAEFLRGTSGNVLLTTGSKELPVFTKVEGYRERFYARVLPLPDVVSQCSALGFDAGHLIGMQGPFSREMNTALLRQIGARWMVTKESGKRGGFPEKRQAAQEAGCGLVVIGRPEKEDGIPLAEALQMLEKFARERTPLKASAKKENGKNASAASDGAAETAADSSSFFPQEENPGAVKSITSGASSIYFQPKDSGSAGEAASGDFREHRSKNRSSERKGDENMLDSYIWEDDENTEEKTGSSSAAQSARVTLVGIGMGTPETLTREGAEAIRNADILIGARRMVEPYRYQGKKIFISYKADEICAFIEAAPPQKKVAVLLSGDSGFYSGAKNLMKKLPEGTRVISGISSLQYFCSRLMTTWEDVFMVSMHGRECDIIRLLEDHPRLFVLVGSRTAAAEICRELADCGLGNTKVSIGERLSYPDEKIRTAQARELTGAETDPLCVMLLERENERSGENQPQPCRAGKPGTAGPGKTPETAGPAGKRKGETASAAAFGYPDSAFIRGSVPMTKEEIRCISVSKLRLRRDAVVYDIGAGTGSVSVEAAGLVPEGRIYAVERDREALELIRRNRQKFAAENLEIVEGTAPEALDSLEKPTHAFIGGSGGNLREILESLCRKNPRIRVVLNVISLETLSEALETFSGLPFEEPEIVCVSVAKAKAAGAHHLMMGQNPVYIISAEGKG